MNKATKIAERILVTFVEAALAYLIIIPKPSFNKTVVAGALGAGLSAVYNLLRESTPSLQSTPPVDQLPPAAPPVAPAV